MISIRLKTAIGAVLTTGAFAGIYLAAQSPTNTLPAIKPGDPLPANRFIELAKAVNPAVVNIFTTYLPKGRRGMMREGPQDPFFDLFERFMGPQGFGSAMPQQSLGTGFIIREDGLIVTNNHVVERADVVKVQLEERNKESFDAKVIGTDPRTDVALLRIETKRKLPFVKLGSSAEVQVGEWVAAFGNPYGYGHTMTKGIISAIGREIDELNLNPFMQTDASINPGNSGGPLVDLQGLVIGVNTAIDARAQGIGFVIPIDSVKSIIPVLEKDGAIKRGFLGVQLADLDEESARMLNIKQTSGALVAQVVAGSAADAAGIQTYDLVVEFDGKKIESSAELRKQVALTQVGRTAPVTVVRNGKAKKLTVKIGTSPELSGGGPVGGRNGGGAGSVHVQGLGFTVTDFSPGLAEEFRLPKLQKPHPVVVGIERGGPAARSGLAPGDLLLDVNRREVSQAREVPGAIRKGAINVLRVLRQDRVVLVPLRAP